MFYFEEAEISGVSVLCVDSGVRVDVPVVNAHRVCQGIRINAAVIREFGPKFSLKLPDGVSYRCGCTISLNYFYFDISIPNDRVYIEIGSVLTCWTAVGFSISAMGCVGTVKLAGKSGSLGRNEKSFSWTSSYAPSQSRIGQVK